MLLDRPVGPLCVLVSGGADSALLLYYLMSQHNDTIHIYTMAAENKSYGKNAKRVPAIIKWCSEQTSNSNYTHTVKNVPEQSPPVLFADALQWISTGHAVALYTGVTANPPSDVMDTFSVSPSQEDINARDPTITRDVYNYKYKSYFPFWNIDKKRIAQLYTEADILPLFNLTSSCEWIHGFPHRPDINPQVDHCGKCWWCQERMWAFGKL